MLNTHDLREVASQFTRKLENPPNFKAFVSQLTRRREKTHIFTALVRTPNRSSLRVCVGKPPQTLDDDENDAEDVNFTVVKTVRALENYESTPFLALVSRNLVAVRTKGRLNLAIN